MPIDRVIERKIANRITASRLRLRFDKVAVRFVDSVKAAVVQTVPESQSIIFTVTAPIKHPAKTSAALQNMLLNLTDGELHSIVNNNQLRARRVETGSSKMPRAIGFVHSAESDAGLILNLVESILCER